MDFLSSNPEDILMIELSIGDGFNKLGIS